MSQNSTLLLTAILVFTLLACSSGGSTPPDTTAPVIALLGANPLTVDIGSNYNDPGAIAIDDRDGDITAKIIVGGDPVVATVVGIYLVTYDVSDNAGNPAMQVTRTVNVVQISKPDAYYPSSGSNWNDYVDNNGADIFSATGAACPATGTGYESCIHAGEIRAIIVPGHSECGDLVASDALGAFDWTCNASTDPVRMVSSGLKDGVKLSDLLDFTLPGWLHNSITVIGTGAGLPFKTTPSVWWSNIITANPATGSLENSGTIYIISSDSAATYALNSNKMALVIQPGYTLSAIGTGEAVIAANSQNFLWLEGSIDATGNGGLFLGSVGFSVLRGIEVVNAATTFGVMLETSSNNSLSNVISTNNNAGIILKDSSNNTLSNMTVTENILRGIWLELAANNRLSNIVASNNRDGIFLSESSRNTFLNVNSSSNSNNGIWLSLTSNNNSLIDITAIGNVFGIALELSLNNTMSNVAVARNNTGIVLGGGSNNKFSNITATDNGSGIYFSVSSNNSLVDVSSTNNDFGIWLDRSSSHNKLLNVTTSNNNTTGLELRDLCHNNSLSNITATNNSGRGIVLDTSSNNSLANITAANNATGLSIDASSNNSLSNVAATDNSNAGISISNSSMNYFTGLLVVGNNVSADCFTLGALPAPGLASITCTDSGVNGSNTYTGHLSDAILSQSTLDTSFVAKVITDDTVNISDTDGMLSSFPVDPLNFDWTTFENNYRGWGPEGSAFPHVDHQGRWTNGAGRIWDWSMRSAVSEIRGVLADPNDADLIPDGNDTITHQWSDSSTSTYLRNASEIMADGIGNDNVLCETGETCLLTPNIGSYQGHVVDPANNCAIPMADYCSVGFFIDGTINAVNLLNYDTNGY